MAYYTPEEMKNLLDESPKYADRLYCKGFLLTTKRFLNLSDYPFYSNWKEQIISFDCVTYYLYTHFETYSYLYQSDNRVFFLIGHAYDPFHMITDEYALLKDMAAALSESEDAYWDRESDLTGVFCTGYLDAKEVVYTTDCCGMQLVYHGVDNEHFYVTSHSKLVADLIGLKQTKYIEKLVSNRFWHYWGTWLPGDCSPYAELRRTVPNCCIHYDVAKHSECIKRFYPTKKIVETTTDEEYESTIGALGRILSNTLTCIAQKWQDKKVAISVTGGRDSMTALSCANGLYDRFSYFSYQSNYDESVDVEAAGKILSHIELPHEVYTIPEEHKEYNQIEVFGKILECNAGCIGHNNENDVRKRLFFYKNPPCDVEVKSWVNEMGRGWEYNEYKKREFPQYPYPAYMRAMHKIYLTPYLIHNTDIVFKNYLQNYYSKEVFDNISWLELYSWEFEWSAGEGVFLTSEHRVSYDITIPFNNRKYIERMLTVPLSKRITDDIPRDLIQYMNPKIAETGIVIKDISHTNTRSFLERFYLEIMSKIRL